jgi:thiamine-phosphate diphosphorylase
MIAAGIRFFQYRSKHSSRRAIYETSLELAATARASGALFILNDHADIAVASGAHGVHLGQDDLPIEEARRITGREMFIGISTHSRDQAQKAQCAGADYIGFGPVFRTATKEAGKARGIDAITSIKQSVSIPVIAIGGIDKGNVPAVLEAGADGIAVISAILKSPDMCRAAAELATLTNRF